VQWDGAMRQGLVACRERWRLRSALLCFALCTGVDLLLGCGPVQSVKHLLDSVGTEVLPKVELLVVSEILRGTVR
jgi:hypothetical protein